MPMNPSETAALVDYRHRVEALYASVRRGGAGKATWERWLRERNQLFGNHPQSPLIGDARAAFAGLTYFPYDPSWRVVAEVVPVEAEPRRLGHSTAGSTEFEPYGTVEVRREGIAESLTLFWLTGYGGGVFLPFRDASNGTSTYAGGRYLLDTVKGADLGLEGGSIVLDFNYAYHPSCVHDGRWSCPLAPRQNHLTFSVESGERLTA